MWCVLAQNYESGAGGYTDVKPQKVEDNKPMFVPVDIRTLNDPYGKKYIYEQAVVIVEQLEKAGISRELVFISVCYFP